MYIESMKINTHIILDYIRCIPESSWHQDVMRDTVWKAAFVGEASRASKLSHSYRSWPILTHLDPKKCCGSGTLSTDELRRALCGVGLKNADVLCPQGCHHCHHNLHEFPNSIIPSAHITMMSSEELVWKDDPILRIQSRKFVLSQRLHLGQ